MAREAREGGEWVASEGRIRLPRGWVGGAPETGVFPLRGPGAGRAARGRGRGACAPDWIPAYAGMTVMGAGA